MATSIVRSQSIATRSRAKCVIVVDDDDDTRSVVAAVLEAEGYEVASFADGERVLEFLRLRRVPCLLLLDLVMPGVDGWQVLYFITGDHQLAERTSVIVLSAVMLGAAALPATAIIQKPIDIGALFTSVAMCCDKSDGASC